MDRKFDTPKSSHIWPSSVLEYTPQAEDIDPSKVMQHLRSKNAGGGQEPYRPRRRSNRMLLDQTPLKDINSPIDPGSALFADSQTIVPPLETPCKPVTENQPNVFLLNSPRMVASHDIFHVQGRADPLVRFHI
jgi:hypothetical protein